MLQNPKTDLSRLGSRRMTSEPARIFDRPKASSALDNYDPIEPIQTKNPFVTRHRNSQNIMTNIDTSGKQELVPKSRNNHQQSKTVIQDHNQVEDSVEFYQSTSSHPLVAATVRAEEPDGLHQLQFAATPILHDSPNK